MRRIWMILASLPSEVTAEVRLFDVRDQKAVFDALDDIGPVDILINNAGNAHGLSQIQTGDLADWDAMIDINVKGLLYVKAVLPSMLNRDSGHIINIDL